MTVVQRVQLFHHLYHLHHHGADDGVSVRVFHVFPGGAHHGSVGPGSVPQPAPPEPPVPGGDGSIPAGAALQGRGGDTDGARPR